MSRARPLALPGAVVAALLVALLLAPGAASTSVHVALVAAAALVVLAAVRALARRDGDEVPSVVDAVLTRKPGRPRRPEDLEQLERFVTIGSASAFDLHYRLRPALAAIADGLLQGRGVDLLAEPEQARLLLGEDAWGLLRPDRPPPEDRHGRALTADGLEAVVAALERVR